MQCKLCEIYLILENIRISKICHCEKKNVYMYIFHMRDKDIHTDCQKRDCYLTYLLDFILGELENNVVSAHCTVAKFPLFDEAFSTRNLE